MKFWIFNFETKQEDLFLKKYAGGGVAEADDTADLLSSIPEGADEDQVAEVMRLQELIANLQDRRQMMHNTVAGKMDGTVSYSKCNDLDWFLELISCFLLLISKIVFNYRVEEDARTEQGDGGPDRDG